MKGRKSNEKTKKGMCSVTRMLSVSLLASASQASHNKHKVENVTPVASDQGR